MNRVLGQSPAIVLVLSLARFPPTHLVQGSRPKETIDGTIPALHSERLPGGECHERRRTDRDCGYWLSPTWRSTKPRRFVESAGRRCRRRPRSSARALAPAVDISSGSGQARTHDYALGRIPGPGRPL